MEPRPDEGVLASAGKLVEQGVGVKPTFPLYKKGVLSLNYPCDVLIYQNPYSNS